MNRKLREELIKIAKEKIKNDDLSHDIWHALRVLKNAEAISKIEKADLDIIIPAALFHDIVNHPKNDPKAMQAPEDSAIETEKILNEIKEYPKEKIDGVKNAISTCSFSKGIKHEILESQIIQDADGLESTGAISIMRTYCSTGTMKRPFYNEEDPFCEKRIPDSSKYALDLFYSRLLKVKDRMYTQTAKKIAEKRTKFLYQFLKQFRKELKGK